jgi:hypothetical protein
VVKPRARKHWQRNAHVLHLEINEEAKRAFRRNPLPARLLLLPQDRA